MFIVMVKMPSAPNCPPGFAVMVILSLTMLLQVRQSPLASILICTMEIFPPSLFSL